MDKCSFLDHSIIARKGVYNNITIYENTIEAIMYSIKNNISINIDISFTLDNEIIVFDRNNITKLLKLKDSINTLNYEELEYIAHFHIPTLKEVIEQVDSKVPIILNVCDDNKIFKNKLLDLISNNKMITVQSNDIDILKFFRKKGMVVGLIIDKKNFIVLNKKLDVDYLCIEYELIDKSQSNILKQQYYIIGQTLLDKDNVKKYIKIYNNLIVDNIEEVFK